MAVRTLIVGMGGISGTMNRVLQEFPWQSTVGVVDVSEEALARAQEGLGLADNALFTDLVDALARSDANAVLINTPSELHYMQTKAVLESGRHALVAKPITNNFEEAVALVGLAEQQGVTLCVGQQMRYNRHYTAVRDFVASGALGRVEMMNFLSAKPPP